MNRHPSHACHDGYKLSQIYHAGIGLHLHLLLFLLVGQFACVTHSFDKRYSTSLRKETEDLFYHGFNNYMNLAFPEDELRPISCVPLGRDLEDAYHFDVNDALGNYSLTLVDSLSTLAILASTPSEGQDNKPLRLFQDGVKAFVHQYGDGTAGRSGQGAKSRGFDLDSKVQVFETSIRGLGGLLSAHLFAVGDLPIRGYNPLPAQADVARSWNKQHDSLASSGIAWPNGLVYDGQLLRLAHDLGQRLIPAFWTSTGLPYPRVNLRHGIPFYENSPQNYQPVEGQCNTEETRDGRKEVTENCSAGAGSLLLEFIVLSRLTADDRFEELAKRAFWSIWSRRSDINLIGAGIDSETGVWSDAFTGIGAGIDSFFEYAFKTYVLLSSDTHPKYNHTVDERGPRTLFGPLTVYEHSAEAFLEAWELAHTAIERHLARGTASQHPHYIQADLNTGASRFFWIDSLSAFYSGLLTLAGHVEQAIKAHLLFTALWTRFSALPERWSLSSGGVEGGLGWWPGRPEFIESNYYLYRATEDPWYKYVAEMTLRDTKRRCWTRCGWAGIQNVLTGELTDRMESFFLGETAKYLFLTFDDDHPLNHLDAPFVFSTEGHPLIIPRRTGNRSVRRRGFEYEAEVTTCPVRPPNVPFSISSTAARGDVYHAASLARLHQMPVRDQDSAMSGAYAIDHPSITISDIVSPSNYTYFPWTLPIQLVPANAMSAALRSQPTFDISFPAMQNNGQPLPPLQRVKDGILVNFVGGVRLNLIQDVPTLTMEGLADEYRIYGINNIFLGKDEKVFLPRHSGFGTINANDPVFTRVQDPSILDLMIDLGPGSDHHDDSNSTSFIISPEAQTLLDDSDNTMKAAWKSLVSQIASLMPEAVIPIPFTQSTAGETQQNSKRASLPAIISSGKGAAPLPDWPEAPPLDLQEPSDTTLPWNKIYAADALCDQKLPISIPRHYQVLVIKRGQCSFSQKLTKIPLFTQSAESLQLVVIVSYGSEEGDGHDEDMLIQPYLDEWQTTSSGLLRQNPIPMVLVGGGEKSYEALKGATGMGIRRRYSVRSQGVPITNLIIT